MLPRCEQFGFDSDKIRSRLNLLHLNQHDHIVAKQLIEDVIRPNIEVIIDQFYDALLFNQETRIWLITGDVIHRLKKTQRDYLLSLGAGFDTDVYFENRLHVGVIHATIGLPLNTYLCAYSILTRIIFSVFPTELKQDLDASIRLIRFINKVTALDMSLAIEAYHASHMDSMTETVKELHTRETHLLKKAETDSLSGLYNRGAVFHYLNKLVSDCLASHSGMYLLMADIDLFKKINDTHGHQAGDVVIRTIADRISNCLRPSDVVGRYGGEEFIVGISGVDKQRALAVAERIRNTIANAPIKVSSAIIDVTISIGMASLDTGDDLNTLIDKADKLLYQAKAAGRNRVVSQL